MKNTNQFIDKALLISDNACEIIKNASTKIKSVKSKGEISNLVTKTDIKVDHLITNFLVENFPNHNIISESINLFFKL